MRILLKTKEIRRFRKALRRFERLHNQQIKDCCAEVTPAQCHFLMELEDSGPITSGKLADVLNIDASTLTRTADRLVERNLIHRQMHPDDRRALLISLTTEGISLCDKLNSENDKRSRMVFELIPGKSRDDVMRHFELLVEAMHQEQESLIDTQPPCCDDN